MIRTIKIKTEPGDWTVLENHGLGPNVYKWEKKFARRYLHRAVEAAVGTKLFFKGSKNMFAVWESMYPNIVIVKVYSGKDAK